MHTHSFPCSLQLLRPPCSTAEQPASHPTLFCAHPHKSSFPPPPWTLPVLRCGRIVPSCPCTGWPGKGRESVRGLSESVRSCSYEGWVSQRRYTIRLHKTQHRFAPPFPLIPRYSCLGRCVPLPLKSSFSPLYVSSTLPHTLFSFVFPLIYPTIHPIIYHLS